MECNKEEAVRAKEIAEQKMQIKDFVGAKKVALKAQQLFPDVDNIIQILTVCQVHCCALVKVNGEMDWYGILQVEQTADDSSIKKQYRKLALLLHPDKNKFAGAEAAFKLIGEAHMTLSDQAKRSLHDMKRRANITRIVPKPPSQKPNMTTFPRKQPAVQNNFSGATTFQYGNINQQKTSGSQTFWTMCPGCCMKFEYFRTLLNKSIRCNRCLTSYVTSELNGQTIPRPWEKFAYPRTHPPNSKQDVPVQANHFVNSSHAEFQGNVSGGPCAAANMAHVDGNSTRQQKEVGVAGGGRGEAQEVKPEKLNTSKAGNKEHQVPSAVNARRKKGRKRAVVSSDSDNSTDSEDTGGADVQLEEQNAGTDSGRYPRRSNRMKQNVTYKEGAIEDDDDFVSPPKRLRKVGASHGADRGKRSTGVASSVPSNVSDDQRDGVFEESFPSGGESMKTNMVQETEEVQDEKDGTRSNAGPARDLESKASPDIRSFSTPDSEFYDFEQERDSSKFAVDQIWAVYDNLDAMPRFYVRIREVFSPFRLRFTWLEHNTLNSVEEAWTLEELPVSCGNYRLGKSKSTTELQMFSHIICWNRGTKRNTYNIRPKKGEIWALFKGWDISWSLDADNHRLYEYEVVEVLSDVSDGSDFLVIRLVKIRGFVSLFVRSSAGDGKLQIPPTEELRFSHRIPSYRTTGCEREGVPEGSFELDTAALPIDFGEAFPSVSLKSLDTASVITRRLDPDTKDSDNRSGEGEEKSSSSIDKSKKPKEMNEMENTHSNFPEGVNRLFHNANSNIAECPVYPSMSSPSPTTYEYLETQFHNFDEDKSIEKFQSGQIWALYSDIDEQPKYYAKIKKVDVKAVVVSVMWAELFPRQKDEVEWRRKDLPATCGRFKVTRTAETFNTTDAFSHLVNAKPTGAMGDLYDIYPRSGEVWALYKDWDVSWKRSTLGKCKYYVVEILEVTGSVAKVVHLTKVANYDVVFMPETEGDVKRMLEIPLTENLRFSHQIPAFRLTSEEGGILRGYWELDSASVPCI